MDDIWSQVPDIGKQSKSGVKPSEPSGSVWDQVPDISESSQPSQPSVSSENPKEHDYQLTSGAMTRQRKSDNAIWIGKEQLAAEPWLRDKGVKEGWYGEGGKTKEGDKGYIDPNSRRPDGWGRYIPSPKDLQNLPQGLVKGAAQTVGGWISLSKHATDALPDTSDIKTVVKGMSGPDYKTGQEFDKYAAKMGEQYDKVHGQSKTGEFIGQQLPYLALPEAKVLQTASVPVRILGRAAEGAGIGTLASAAQSRNPESYNQDEGEYWEQTKEAAKTGAKVGAGLGAIAGAIPSLIKGRKPKTSAEPAATLPETFLEEPQTLGQVINRPKPEAGAESFKLGDKNPAEQVPSGLGRVLNTLENKAEFQPFGGMVDKLEKQRAEIKAKLGDLAKNGVEPKTAAEIETAVTGKGVSDNYKDIDSTGDVVQRSYEEAQKVRRDIASRNFNQVKFASDLDTTARGPIDKSNTIRAYQDVIDKLSDRDVAAAKALQKHLDEILEGNKPQSLSTPLENSTGKTWEGLQGIKSDLQAAANRIEKGLNSQPIDRALAAGKSEISRAILKDMNKHLDKIEPEVRKIFGSESDKILGSKKLSDLYKETNEYWASEVAGNTGITDKTAINSLQRVKPGEMDKYFDNIFRQDIPKHAADLYENLTPSGRLAVKKELLTRLSESNYPSKFIEEHGNFLKQFVEDAPTQQYLESIRNTTKSMGRTFQYHQEITTGKSLAGFTGLTEALSGIGALTFGHPVTAAVALSPVGLSQMYVRVIGNPKVMTKLLKIIEKNPEVGTTIQKSLQDPKIPANVRDGLMETLFSSKASRGIRTALSESDQDDQKTGKGLGEVLKQNKDEQ